MENETISRPSKPKSEWSLQEFFIIFTEEYCEHYLKLIRYSDGNIFCPYCGADNPYYTNRGYKCRSNSCYKKFTIETNTIFQNRKVPLLTWFTLIYQMSHNNKSISSVQYSKNLGVTQLIAYKMMSKIRSVLIQSGLLFSGIVEVDESFISKGEWHRWGSDYIRKTPVLGLFERSSGRVVLKSMENRRKDTIIPIIERHVEKDSTIFTDGYNGYRKLQQYKHDYVEHAYREYVRGEVHTNNIEHVWGFFKRNIKNIHHSISNKNLQSYLDECAFKFNNRRKTKIELFDMILRNCIYG